MSAAGLASHMRRSSRLAARHQQGTGTTTTTTTSSNSRGSSDAWPEEARRDRREEAEAEGHPRPERRPGEERTMVLILDDSLEGQEEEEEVRSRHRRATTAKDVHKRMEVGEGKEGSTSTPPVAAAVGFSQEVCAICLEAIREPAAQPNSCSHCFCFDCLFTWSRCAAVCPLCKRHFHSIATRPVLRPQPAPLERRRPIHIDLEEIVISDNEDEGGGGQFHTANAGADQRQQQQAPAVMIDLTDVGGVSTDEQHGGVAMVEVHVPGSDGEEDEGEQAPIVGSFSGCMIIG